MKNSVTVRLKPSWYGKSELGANLSHRERTKNFMENRCNSMEGTYQAYFSFDLNVKRFIGPFVGCAMYSTSIEQFKVELSPCYDLRWLADG